MGCGCRGKRTQVSTSLASSSTGYQVWKNGSYTGRQFTSLASAQSYANKIDGEVVAL